MHIEEFLKRLDSVRKTGGGWHARCPVHADNDPSLSVTKKDGKILLHCFAGCPPDAVMKAVGIEAKDLFTNTTTATKPRKRKDHDLGPIVAEYSYVDENGVVLCQKVRHEPKTFRLRRPDGKGGWIANWDGVRRVLYNLPAVIAATNVIVTEGERDAETGKVLGFVTTTSGGTGSWLPEFADVLCGKHITVISDADAPGRKHAQQVASSLLGKAESLKVLELPGAKDLSEFVERSGTRDAITELLNNTPQWNRPSIDGAEILSTIYRFVRRFVSLTEPQAAVISLWVAHTYAIDAADATPYIAITSAEKQSGKTRLLEVMQIVVANPWLTGRVTAAVLVRKIDADKPTLLLDESDAAFGGEKEYAEALRGILNTGHRRGGVASLCVGKGAEISFKDFSTFCPKAIAGIGRLPDTVADRSIPIRLKRAAPGEVVERFRIRNVTPEAEVLRARIEAWCDLVVDDLRDARPALPDELSDRQQDGVEPLLAIADAAGQGWPEVGRAALVTLCVDTQDSDGSTGVRLLSDVRQVFDLHGADKLPSAALTEALAAIETSPWGEWSHGKPLSAPKLAKLLRPFGVTPRTIRIGAATSKGYELADFEDPFKRYLRLPAPSPSYPPASKASQPSHPNTDAGFVTLSKPSQSHGVTPSKCEIANTDAGCDGVTVLPPISGMRGEGRSVEEVL